MTTYVSLITTVQAIRSLLSETETVQAIRSLLSETETVQAIRSLLSDTETVSTVLSDGLVWSYHARAIMLSKIRCTNPTEMHVRLQSFLSCLSIYDTSR